MRRSIFFGTAGLLFLLCLSATAIAADSTNFANDGFASQISMNAFNQSVKHRLEVARFGFYGGVSVPPAQRQVAGNITDCPTSSFTVWADGYGAWGKQKTNSNGYKIRLGGPALGFDWSNGPVTLGIATTYAWGKIQARDIDHDRKTRMFGTTAYAQVNYERFYVNAALSYGYNRFKSERWTINGLASAAPAKEKYHSNAWNAELEVGTRLNFCNFLLEPHIGVNYFTDRRKSFDEGLPNGAVNTFNKRTYHALEMPLGLNVGYEIAVGNTMLIPRLRFDWVPQFDRKYGKAYTDDGSIRERSQRARHGFILGAGVQAKVYKSVSAHIDYNVNMRSKAYEHMINAGLGVSF